MSEMTRQQKLEFLRTHSLYSHAPPHDLLPRRTPRPHPVVLPAKAVREAAASYKQAFQRHLAMSIANPGHASLPLYADRLDKMRDALFAAIKHQDRFYRQAYLLKFGI